MLYYSRGGGRGKHNFKYFTYRQNISFGSALVYLPSYFPASLSHAQTYTITQHCETTVIQLPDGSILPDSEITTCDVNIEETTINDFSGATDQSNPTCASGNCTEGTTVSPLSQCQMEQMLESDTDRLAKEIAEAIKSLNNAMSNPDNAEFGAFIIKLDNGLYVSSPIRTGQTGQVSMRQMLSSAQSAYPGINASNIAAIVHSHPREAGPGFASVTNIGELSPLDYGNTMPSHPNISAGPNDWDNGRSFLLANGRSSVADVSHYILGPDGVLRQYKYADGHPAEATEQQQRINDAAKNADGECS